MLGIFLALLKTNEEKKRFHKLFYEYRSTIYNYAYQILGDAQDSEDAVSEAFLSLSRNMEKIEDKSDKDARNYLIVIVKNIARQIYNKQNNIVYVENFDDYNNYCTENIELEISNRDIRDKIHHTIKKMDEKYSDVLMLKYYYQLKDAEIAEELGLTIENVKIRLNRAKKYLKNELEKESLYNG